MANKWTFKSRVKLSGQSKSDCNLQKIVQFYLWETPVPETSEKGTSFSSMGIQKGKYKTLQAEMRKVSGGFPAADGHNWIRTTIKSIEEELKALDRLEKYDCSLEFAVHTVKSELGKTEALFYFIRNAFAHGGFRISKYKGERYFVLENRQDRAIKGRAILKESTLLSWAKLISDLRSKKKALTPSSKKGRLAE